MKLASIFLITAMAAVASKLPTLTTLYNFSDEDQGAYSPYGGLVRSHSGVLYGTADYGGAHGSGAVYSLTPPGPGAAINSMPALTWIWPRHPPCQPISFP